MAFLASDPDQSRVFIDPLLRYGFTDTDYSIGCPPPPPAYDTARIVLAGRPLAAAPRYVFSENIPLSDFFDPLIVDCDLAVWIFQEPPGAAGAERGQSHTFPGPLAQLVEGLDPIMLVLPGLPRRMGDDHLASAAVEI